MHNYITGHPMLEEKHQQVCHVYISTNLLSLAGKHTHAVDQTRAVPQTHLVEV